MLSQYQTTAYQTTRLPDYPTTRLPSYPTTRLFNYPTTRLPNYTHTPSTSSTHHPTHPTHPPQPKTHTPHLSYPIPLTTPTIFTPKIHLFTDRPPTDHPKHHFVLTQMLTISNPNFDHIHTYYIPPDGWAPHTRPVCGFPHLLQYMPHTLKIRTYVYADIARHLSRDREKCRPLALLRFALGVGTAMM